MNEHKTTVVCPNRKCRQKLLLPKLDEILRVRCPKCRRRFRYRYPSILQTQLKPKWYHRSWVIIPLLLFFAPLGIILLWSGSRYRLPVRIGVTVAFGLLFVNQSINYIRAPSYRDYSPLPRWGTTVETIRLQRLPMEPFELLSEEPREIQEELTTPEIVERVGGAIVSIEPQDAEGRVFGSGSGVVIHSAGIIVTNYHVLGGAHFAEVRLEGNQMYDDVFFLGGDIHKDLAIIRIGASGLPVASLGDSSKVRVGEKVVAIGNPLGYERSVSEGIISGIREIEGVKYFQMTTPISPGSSGGALLNTAGEVIGITSMGYFEFAQNLNFAVPIEEVRSLLETVDR